MNNVGVPLSDNSQYERPPIAAMFNVPYTYRCDMRREFVKRWCNSNVDIICYVTKVWKKALIWNHRWYEKWISANRKADFNVLYEYYMLDINNTDDFGFCYSLL